MVVILVAMVVAMVVMVMVLAGAGGGGVGGAGAGRRVVDQSGEQQYRVTGGETGVRRQAELGQQPTGVRTRPLLNTQTQAVSTALLGDNSPPASGHVPCRTHRHRLSVQHCWGTTDHRRPDTSPAEHTDTDCQYSAAGGQQTTGVRTRPLLNTQTQTQYSAAGGH